MVERTHTILSEVLTFARILRDNQIIHSIKKLASAGYILQLTLFNPYIT